MTELVLRADRVVTGEGVLEPGEIGVEPASGLVSFLRPASRDRGARDLSGHLVVPGFVDLHVHGGDGAGVNGDDPGALAESLERISSFHASHGTTTMLATTVSDSAERLAASVSAIAAAARRRLPGARIAGANLEGPFLARARRGAQDLSALRRPDLAELDHLLELASGSLRMLTLAPELPGAAQLIGRLRRAGVVVALGHSDADFETARSAFEAGASHVTHLFNAMPPLHHRLPGLAGAALLREGVSLELVADLHHVHPAVIALVARLAPGRVVAVTDCTPAAGLPPGRHRLGRVEVVLDGDRVELADDPGTLAGSVLTMDRAVANLLSRAGLSFEEALAAATVAPGRLLERAGVPGIGRLALGGQADLVVLRPDFEVAATMVAGHAVYDPGGLLR